MANNSSVPGPPQAPIATQNGSVTPPWYAFFLSILDVLGGAGATISATLDTITNAIGSILYRGDTGWQGLAPGTQYNVLRMGTQFPEWDKLDGNSFGGQEASFFFAGPLTGDSPPGFRLIASSDLQNIAGQYPGTASNNNAANGNIGEYIFSQIAIGGAVSLVTATTKDITNIQLTEGDWNVWGSLTTNPATTTTQANIQGWISETSATDPAPPNLGAYCQLNTAIAAGLTQTLQTGMTRITIPSGNPVTVYLSTKVSFAVSTMTAYGFIGARRAR